MDANSIPLTVGKSYMRRWFFKDDDPQMYWSELSHHNEEEEVMIRKVEWRRLVSIFGSRKSRRIA
jgi:hypothetical protein